MSWVRTHMIYCDGPMCPHNDECLNGPVSDFSTVAEAREDARCITRGRYDFCSRQCLSDFYEGRRLSQDDQSDESKGGAS